MKSFAKEPGDPEEEDEEDSGEEDEEEEEDYEEYEFDPYYEYFDELQDIDLILGGREDVYLGELSAVYFSGDPEWEETPLEVTDAFADDPGVAEISLEYPDLYITGKKAGSTRITVAYEGPEGPGTTDFNVSVKETVYRVVLEGPDSDGLLKPGSSAALRLSVYRMNAGDDDYTPVDEKDVTVVWSNFPYDYEDCFDLKGNGFSAALSVDPLPYHVSAGGYVLAEVYQGSEVSEGGRIGSGRLMPETDAVLYVLFAFRRFLSISRARKLSCESARCMPDTVSPESFCLFFRKQG